MECGDFNSENTSSSLEIQYTYTGKVKSAALDLDEVTPDNFILNKYIDTAEDKTLVQLFEENENSDEKQELDEFYPSTFKQTIEKEAKMNTKSENSTYNLYVMLKNEDLLELQKKQRIKKEPKRKWLKWNNAEDVRVFGCRGCHFKCDNKYLLLIHLADNHKEIAEQKNLIDPRYLTPGDSPDEVRFKCTECCYITKIKQSFKIHLLTHQSLDELEKTFRCASCSFVAKRREGLIKHLLVHKSGKDIKMYKCQKCDYQTKGNGYLSIHIKMVHNASEQMTYRCKDCSFKTKYKTSLNRHRFMHKN